MWIFTPYSFVAITRDKDDSEQRHVRTRRKQHMEAMFPNAKCQFSMETDYPFLAQMHSDDVAEAVLDQITRMNYTHFQTVVPPMQPNYLEACNNVWRVMQAFQYSQYYGPKTDFEKLVSHCIFQAVDQMKRRSGKYLGTPTARQIMQEYKHERKAQQIEHRFIHERDWS